MENHFKELLRKSEFHSAPIGLKEQIMNDLPDHLMRKVQNKRIISRWISIGIPCILLICLVVVAIIGNGFSMDLPKLPKIRINPQLPDLHINLSLSNLPQQVYAYMIGGIILLWMFFFLNRALESRLRKQREI